MTDHCVAATLHSFTMSLRHQLRDTNVRVVELIPPLVDSPLLPAEFKGKALPIDEFVSSATEQLLQDVTEIGYKSDNIIRGSRDDLDAQFREWNDWSEKLKMSHTSSQQSQHSQSSQKKEMM